MENSMGLGFMAAFAVSGSIVLIAREVHKRLLSDFMKKIEFELCGSKRCHAKKKVRFAANATEPSSKNEEYRKRNLIRMMKGDQVLKMEDAMGQSHGAKSFETMPLNRQMLYRGIMEYKNLKGYNI